MTNNRYRDHYVEINKTYPSVLALKLFLGNNPDFDIKIEKPVIKNIIDIGFGDGRDIGLFLEMGLHVSGIEPNIDVVNHTSQKYYKYRKKLDLRIGTNVNTGFNDNTFDVAYASASIYYLPSLEYSILDSLSEAYRIIKPGGLIMGSFARSDIHTVAEATKINNNIFILKDPYYKFREGQVYHTYNDKNEVLRDFGKIGFKNPLVYDYNVNWFGTRETLFIFVAKK